MAVTVPNARFEQLERKERAHDAYREAIKATQDRFLNGRYGIQERGPFYRGYVQALEDMADSILAATQRQEDAREV